MAEHRDESRVFHGPGERLRAPARLARLEVPRVVELCLSGIEASSVLDVGTGTGVFAEAFTAAGLSATGIDLNPELLAVARDLVPEAIFMEAGADALPCDDSAHDLVFLGHLLHEVDDPLAVLREARRVARNRVAVLEWPYREDEQGPPLEHRMQPETVADLARQAGFCEVETLELEHMTLFRMTV
ncbi:MAG: methyltransferase domain-containing protein [Spirochaetota bacterium]